MEMGLLEMCFSASVIILVVVICRALFINKLPKKVFLVLWAVALSRLLIPYSLPSVSSIYSLAGKSQFIMDKAEGIINGTEEKQENEKNAGNIIIKERNEKKGLSVLGAVWLAGFIISVLVFITAYILLYRRFCTSLPVNNRFAEEWLKSHKTIRRLSIRQSGFIKSPLSYGIFHPVILMPETTDWEDSKKLMYILEHEFIHIKRFDAVTKLLLIAAASIYWFNPLVWVMYILANRDIEISCDETVVRHFGEKSKKAYALVLISMEEEKSGFSPLGNSFSRNAAEERITAIMQIKKNSKAAYIKAFLLIAVIIPVFATSAKSTGRPKKVFTAREEGTDSPGIKENTLQEDISSVTYSNVLGEIAAGIAAKGDYYALYSLAPFVKQEDLNKIAEQIAAKGDYSAITGLASFISREVINGIAKDMADKGEYDALESIAPFIQ